MTMRAQSDGHVGECRDEGPGSGEVWDTVDLAAAAGVRGSDAKGARGPRAAPCRFFSAEVDYICWGQVMSCR